MCLHDDLLCVCVCLFVCACILWSAVYQCCDSPSVYSPPLHLTGLLFLQSRASTLSKQLNEIHDQVEQLQVECRTFEQLRAQELQAIPKRIEVRTHVPPSPPPPPTAHTYVCHDAYRKEQHPWNAHVSMVFAPGQGSP